jgi:hypothetical protein
MGGTRNGKPTKYGVAPCISLGEDEEGRHFGATDRPRMREFERSAEDLITASPRLSIV